MAFEKQANWRLPLQQFQAWIRRERVTGSQGDYAAGLEDFIPAGEVEAYLRQSGQLRRVLKALFPDDGAQIDARKLLARYSVVFAILVSIDYGTYIGSFTPHDSLCDARLPFTERPTRFPKDSNDSDIFFERFQVAQARFCAPTFSIGHHQFEKEDILPFLEKTFVGDGGSAKVYRVKLHAKHDFLSKPETPPDTPTCHKFYALKAYDGEGGERWHGIETATFEKLKRTGLDVAHMIGYYCSYEHRGVCYALLEYADLDTLEHFMMREENVPPSTDEEILSLWENLLHVTEAIGEIHELDPDDEYTAATVRFTGIHQDIKPTNILVKSKEHASNIYDSAFGLADLGTSSLIKAETEASRSARDNYGTKTYGSPECFRKDSIDDYRNIKITTAADIWSWGCVLSEVCIWVVFGREGPNGLRSYRQRRETHNRRASRGSDCFHLGGKESQAVIDEHKKAASQHRCDPITRAILELMPKMLHLDAKHRPSAQELRTRFVEIIHEAKGDAIAGASRSSYATSTRKTSGSTKQSSGPPSPLSQHRVRRTTGSSSQNPPHVGGKYSTISGSPETQTPRTLTLDDKIHHKNENGFPLSPVAPDMLARQLEKIELPAETPVNTTCEAPPNGDQISAVDEPRGQQDRPHAGTPPSANSAQPPAAPDTSRAEGHEQGTPPAKLEFKDAFQWRQQMRNKRSMKRLPDQNLLSQLRGRDHVFVIDDCQSMGKIRAASRVQRQSEIADYIDVLSYMVKHHDPDGMDLLYFNSDEVIKRSKAAKKLVTSVNDTRFTGLSNPDGALKSLLKSYIARIKAYKVELRDFETRGRRTSLFSLSGIPKPPTPLSVYVLTDGVWESPNTAGGSYLVEDTLKELIEVLLSAGCGREQVGIQFIRFGADENGVQRLEALDRLGRNDDALDIVDTEPAEGGNVWKMLLGAINPRFDGD